MDLTTIWDILRATLIAATPLLIAALGGLYSERSGVVNIALEGMMLSGAFAAVVFSYFSGSAWIGLLGAVLVGALMGLIHAVVSIKYKANQVVSGTAINLLAVGATLFLLQIIFNVAGTTPQVDKLPSWGPFNPVVYLGIILLLVTHYLLYYTPFGLRLRSVGEYPKAADTLGISVPKIRYIAVVISGALAGLAGASLSIGELNVFVKNMTAGRGFIALAALIFGKWTPFGAFGASLLFGFTDTLQQRLQGFAIPTELVQIMPYIITMIALAGVIGRATPPAAVGEPFERKGR